MATNVGDVYVSVHVDNSRLRNELRAQGAKDAKSYGDAFDKEMGEAFEKTAKKNRQKLADAFASGDFSKFEKEMGSVAAAVRKVDDEVNHLIATNKISLKQAREIKKAVAAWAVPAKMAEDTRLIAEATAKAARETRNLGNEAANVGRKAKRGASEAGTGFRDAAARAKTFGALIGGTFGKGSRNNFLNIVGGIVGKMSTLSALFSELGIEAFKAGARVLGLGDSLKNVGDGLTKIVGSGVAGVVSNVASGIPGLIALAATVGTIIATVVTSAGIMAAAVSVLAGMLLALASAVSFAIAGALLPLGPALLAAAPALGLIIGLMQDFNKTAKEQPKWVKDIKKAWDDATGTISKAKEGVGKALAGFFPILTGIWNPLVTSTATAMAAIIKDLGTILTSPAMKGFTKQFQSALPAIFQNLGLGFNRAFAGLIAFFTPILPFAVKLSDAFQKLMATFQGWAQSAEGQNAISEFMDKAWEAAKTLWDIIVNLTTAIGGLFGAGEETGQGFLDKIAEITEKFSDWVNSTEGQAQLKQWFEDAKRVAGDLWGVIQDLAALFDQLDTEENRRWLSLLIQMLGNAIRGTAALVGWIQDAHLQFGFLSLAAAGVQKAMELWGTAVGKLGDVWASLKVAALEMAVVVVGVFADLVDAVLGALQQMLDGAVAAFGWMPVIGPQLKAAAGGVAAFRDSANGSLRQIEKNLKINLDTAQAEKNARDLKNAMNGLTDKTVVVTNEIRYVVKGKTPTGGTVTAGGLTKDAAGAIHTGPTHALVGEAGPEAVVPLNRPLALVDPAVRALSAIAQGKTSMAAGGVVSGGRTINVSPGAITVNTTQASPVGVAMSVLDRLTAAAV